MKTNSILITLGLFASITSTAVTALVLYNDKLSFLQNQQPEQVVILGQITPSRTQDSGNTAEVILQNTLVKQRETLVKNHKEILENKLRTEQADPKWAKYAQTKLSSLYGTVANKGIQFVAADCRSTICKVNMALNHPGKQNELQLRILMDSPTPWRTPRFMQLNKQTGEVVMYMMREDYPLPKLPAEN